MAEAQYIELKYYSKSKCFLYPILNFRKREAFRADSYLFFNDHSIVSGELTTYFPHNGGELYRNFEQQRISPHPLLRACYQVNDGSIYVFDISGHHEDIELFLRGEYSKFSKSLKRTILKYFDDDIEPMAPRSDRFIHAVLFPQEYRPFVAKQLGDVPVKNLSELASLYDLEKEILHAEDYKPCYQLD